MGKLAINGGTPVRSEPLPSWPIYDERESRALLDVLHSGRWTSAPYVFGDRLEDSQVHKLEREFAAYHGVKYGVATGSGTDALQLAFRAAGVRPGDEVIVPPNTFIAGVTPILQLDAVPIFVDVEADTLCLDPEAVEDAISERTRVISPLHLGGYPADMDRIVPLARKYNLKIVADACHAHGSEWRGQKLPIFADLNAFSFQQEKQITSGEGGMLLTNDRALYELCYSYHNDGRGMGAEGNLFVAQGWNFRMSEFQGALLRAQLSRLDEIVDTKQDNAERLAAGLAEIGGLSWPRQDPRITRQSYLYPRMRYDARAFENVPGEVFARAMTAEGIPCNARGGWLLYKHPLFSQRRFDATFAKQIDYDKVHCPVAENASGHWISFPQTVLLDQQVVDDFIEAVAKLQKNLAELQKLSPAI